MRDHLDEKIARGLIGLKEAEVALADPLKPETRKARLYLLGVSVVSIAIVWTGLVPQEISTLGITFGQANRQALLVILALVVVYFLGAFAIYGASDYLASRYAYMNAVWVERKAFERRDRESEKKFKKRPPKLREARTELKEARERAVPIEKALHLARETLDDAQEQLREYENYFEKVSRDAPYDEDAIESANRQREEGQAKAKEARRALEQHEQYVSEAADEVARAKKHVQKLRQQFQRKIEQEEQEEQAESYIGEASLNSLDIHGNWAFDVFRHYGPNISLVRQLFEFLLPIFVGAYAVFALLFG